MNVRNLSCDLLNNYKKRNKYVVELKDLEEIDKPSIVSDTMFKTMFQNESRIKYSAYLISLIVDVSYKKLLDNIKLKTNEIEKDMIYRKGERCDYVAEIDGTKLNIEVNNNGEAKTLERNLEYAFRLYGSRVRIGSRYTYNQVIQINLNNFSFEDKSETMNVSYIKDDKGVVLTDKLIIVNIYLPNVLEKCYTKGINKLNELEKYLYSLIEYDVEKLESITREVAIVKEYVEESMEVGKEEFFGEAYDHEKANMEQSYLYGVEDGIQKGIEQGIEKNKRENAKKLYNNGVSKEIICKSLDIKEEKLDQILK